MAGNETVAVLTRCPLFKGIAAADLGSILACLAAREKRCRKQETIFMTGDKANRVGVVLAGEVQVLREDVTGNRTILARLTKGDIFGETFACAAVEYLPVTVVAATDCQILLLDYRKIITTCSSACLFHSRLVENMLAVLAEKNLRLNEKLEYLAQRTTRERLLAYFRRQAGRKGSGTFSIPFNRQELADYLCCDRSAVSRELSRMQAEGLIQFHKNQFTLLPESV